MGALLAVLVVGLVIANSYATRLVLREDAYELSQKYSQIAIIWLIPIIGSVIVCGIILSDRAESKPLHSSNNEGFYVDSGVAVPHSAATESLDGD